MRVMFLEARLSSHRSPRSWYGYTPLTQSGVTTSQGRGSGRARGRTGQREDQAIWRRRTAGSRRLTRIPACGTREEAAGHKATVAAKGLRALEPQGAATL